MIKLKILKGLIAIGFFLLLGCECKNPDKKKYTVYEYPDSLVIEVHQEIKITIREMK